MVERLSFTGFGTYIELHQTTKKFNMSKSLFIVVCLLIHIGLYAQEDKKGVDKLMGEKTLPSVTLSDINGKQVNVAGYGKSGKITVLSFWATWCVPCKKELTNLADLYTEWKSKY